MGGRADKVEIEVVRVEADLAGAERIMLGSDYPFRGELGICVQDIARADIADDARAAILGGTAERWFGPAPRLR